MVNDSNEQSDIFEAATNILETLLGLMDIEASVTRSDEFTLDDDDNNASSVGLNIEGEDLGILIGRRGQTMASLQYIVRIIMAHKMQVRIPIVLDVEGYKQRRCNALQTMALRIADQVTRKKERFALEPMPAFDRRIIHLALVDHPDVTTESSGEGEARRVVIIPKELPSN